MGSEKSTVFVRAASQVPQSAQGCGFEIRERENARTTEAMSFDFTPDPFVRPPSKWNASGAFSVARHGVARFDARTVALR